MDNNNWNETLKEHGLGMRRGTTNLDVITDPSHLDTLSTGRNLWREKDSLYETMDEHIGG